LMLASGLEDAKAISAGASTHTTASKSRNFFMMQFLIVIR
jgi:hypothetical protein